ETVLLRAEGPGVPVDFAECVARQVEDLRFNYGRAEDYYFCYKLYPGRLGTSLNHELDLALSDRDFVDVTVEYLPADEDEDDDEDGQEEVQELNPAPLLSLDTNLESGVHTVKLTLDKVNNNIPASFLGLSLITKTAYKIGFHNDANEALESKLVSSRLRSNIYESFSVFTKGFVQDRAFNALYGDTTAAQASNYAKFSSAFNEFISKQNMRECTWGQFEAGEQGCKPIGENFIYLRYTNGDDRNLDLQELYNRLGILATDVTVVLEGFNVFIGSDFVLDENPLGLIVKSDKENRGGRAFVDYDVNNIINLFLYLDKNLMSVESLEKVNAVVTEDAAVTEDNFASLGVGSFAADSSYNQLVFAGQLISNNCSGCSRADAGRQASKADGSLVKLDNDKDVILAKQEDLNNMRYSPLVFNVERRNGGLVHLDCNNDTQNGRLINGDFFDRFSLEDMCYMPERFGFNISRSELLAGFDASATRSFMMFYKNPKNLPVFGDWN
ncbi:hypothetical protein HOH51_01350, partial [bacterium]|nr:hypothetical protein [bacterium]